MADGDGGVFPLEQLGDGGADDAAAAQHHHVLASDFHARALDELHAASRCARDEPGEVIYSHTTLVDCVQANGKYDYGLRGLKWYLLTYSVSHKIAKERQKKARTNYWWMLKRYCKAEIFFAK